MIIFMLPDSGELVAGDRFSRFSMFIKPLDSNAQGSRDMNKDSRQTQTTFFRRGLFGLNHLEFGIDPGDDSPSLIGISGDE